MADKKKKMAAALAAVSAYMQEEEAAVQQASAVPSVSSEVGISQWSFSGRQEMMAMRRLVQLRVFDRFR
ncbi:MULTISPECIES: hypothetical protein [Desulfosediminicola]|uniref:hypothetical protein n=1 Tax=Desulfosediminicola TaxID=2886823 RepID=UPI0010AD05A7|nr:hypothetical protein [Desulfosediminicola ganghwensis]